MDNDESNPFLSPTPSPNGGRNPDPDRNHEAGIDEKLRESARTVIHFSCLLLFLPALHNAISIGKLSQGISWIENIGNFVFLTVAVVASYIFGLPIFEKLAMLIRWAFRGQQDTGQWLRILHQRLSKIFPLIFLGTIVWVIWNFAFFDLQVPFMVISIPVGVVSHLLAAAFYVPLFWEWYKLEKQNVSKDASVPVDNSLG